MGKNRRQRASAKRSPVAVSSPWKLRLGLVFLVLVVCELLAVAFFHFFRDRFVFPEPGPYVATVQEIRASQRTYDPELGWTLGYDTPLGERPRPRSYGRPAVAAFGDSFTHGDEVDHRSNWCAVLASLLRGDVYNFGVGAYGMDQALLRAEKRLPQRPVEVAIFAFISLDIRRNVSVYRKFQHPKGNFVLTKPRFLPRGEGLELLPNPIADRGRLARLKEEEVIRQLGVHDHWYNPHDLPELGFPRLGIFLRPGFWRYVLGQEEDDLWLRDGEARRVSERILARFHAFAREQGARPIILHLPLVAEMLEYAETGTSPPAVAHLRSFCAENGLECWAPLETAADLSAARITSKGRKGGHLSPEGNRWVARFLAQRLRPESSP